MVPQPRAGTFSPNRVHSLQTGGLIGQSPHPSQSAILSAGASPSTASPTGTSSVSRIVVAQVYLLLGSLKEDKEDPSKLDSQIDQLRKLVDDHDKEVFHKYFARIMTTNAGQSYSGSNRPAANAGITKVMEMELRRISRELDQASKIADSIENGTDDFLRDLDLAAWMAQANLDALEKTILALAFKLGSRADLKKQADSILQQNFAAFINILSQPSGEHADLSPALISLTIDRFLQNCPSAIGAPAKTELTFKVQSRYAHGDPAPPPGVLAALDLVRVVADKPPNALATYIRRNGSDFTRDENNCTACLQNRPPNVNLSEEQVSVALYYTTISQSPPHDPSVLVAGLRRVLPPTFSWQNVVSYFDQRNTRISSEQFLRLYNSLLPIAHEQGSAFDIQTLWGGSWEHPETQLSFICAFASLTPEQLDATTIPGLRAAFTLEDYIESSPEARERAVTAVKHPLVSVAALEAVFNVALHSVHASTSTEAKRLFQQVVVPNIDIFVVSAFCVPQPWPNMAVDTFNSLFDNFLYKRSAEYDFVLESLWRRDKAWVRTRLIDSHATKPIDLPIIFEHAVKHNWLDDLVYLPTGFGLDLTALAHAEGRLDLSRWMQVHAEHNTDILSPLMRFLEIKASQEVDFQRTPEGQPPIKTSTTLRVKTVNGFLQILEAQVSPVTYKRVIETQRGCITVFPRLINYDQGYNDIIDANGKDTNAFPSSANAKMEEHYKKMYGDEVDVRTIVDILRQYKHSRDSLDQDVFASMIHGLFDEYSHYADYPLEALATTAVLFGGIISHNLIAGIPLKIGLDMILEAVRDHLPDESMYKFGLQALIQLFSRFREWPRFCEELLCIPGLQGTEAWKKAEDIVGPRNEEQGGLVNGSLPGTESLGHAVMRAESLANGNVDEPFSADQHSSPFAAIRVEPIPAGFVFEDPSEDTQGKILFALNNLTETSVQSLWQDIRGLLHEKHQQWFASHLVEERAKMQPNFHHVYLDLIDRLGETLLWAQILRETFSRVKRLLDAESTTKSTMDRNHLKNLGGWLGLITLARDKPILLKNIAFKDLLIEAHDTKRLIVVIPFVCKVLLKGKDSRVFKPPNPWLMDIIHLLIELYHNAEMKLNLKFEIEVLCQELHLDHKSIEPSGEIRNRAGHHAITLDETSEAMAQETLDTFESLSLNGMGPGVASGVSTHPVAPTIPDLGSRIQIPPTSEMVITPTRLHDIVSNALTRALQDIIQPVVDRSVTIAAISTQQMIHKDFVTEPDENRVRTSAINMVKAAAGSLALVTSKDPLRSTFANYMRSLSNELPQPLPEGTIIMCVNANLDLASNIIEKSAQERAVPEIEEMMESELDARRRHRAQRPNEPYVGPDVNRWSWTIPNPYKLSTNPSGLNPEQMAIYEDFARQSRAATGAPSISSHVPSTSDATRSMANEVLQDQYSSVPNIPTPAETPSMPPLGNQLQQYAQAQNSQGVLSNGRQTVSGQVDATRLVERVVKLLEELQRAAVTSREEHYADLPRGHQVIDIVDAVNALVIKAHSQAEDFNQFTAPAICDALITHSGQSSLFLESLVEILGTIRKIASPALNQRVNSIFLRQSKTVAQNVPLIAALLNTDLLDWEKIDVEIAKSLRQRQEGALDTLERLLDLTVLTENPVLYNTSFVHSMEEAWLWLDEEDVIGGRDFKAKLLDSVKSVPSPATLAAEQLARRHQDQMEYVFEEWVHMCSFPDVSDQLMATFVQQMWTQGVVGNRDDFYMFVRAALEKSISQFELTLQAGATISDSYSAIDSLARLVTVFVVTFSDHSANDTSTRLVLIDSTLSLAVLVLNYHHLRRGEHFNQRAFFRFFSTLLHEVGIICEDVPDEERNEIIFSFADKLNDLGPSVFPGFIYGWISLIQHRVFLPTILRTLGQSGWAPFTRLMKQLLQYLGAQLKHVEVSHVAKDVYRAALRLIVILQHDYPDYLACNHMQLVESIPSHCVQLINMVLMASPSSYTNKVPDPTQPGLKVDRLDEMRNTPPSTEDPASFLRQMGLVDVLEQALHSGPSEDTVAQITHAITRSQGGATSFGLVPLSTNVKVIDAVVLHVGNFAASVAGNGKSGVPVFSASSTDFLLLSMLVHELDAEARYHLLSSMVNQLRYPNAHTRYFSQVLIAIFAHDLGDPEEMEIRQQMTRCFLERLIGFWPQPWGLIVALLEIIKNEKYLFFELPFIKSDHEMAEQFMMIVQQHSHRL